MQHSCIIGNYFMLFIILIYIAIHQGRIAPDAFSNYNILFVRLIIRDSKAYSFFNQKQHESQFCPFQVRRHSLPFETKEHWILKIS